MDHIVILSVDSNIVIANFLTLISVIPIKQENKNTQTLELLIIKLASLDGHWNKCRDVVTVPLKRPYPSRIGFSFQIKIDKTYSFKQGTKSVTNLQIYEGCDFYPVFKWCTCLDMCIFTGFCKDIPVNKKSNLLLDFLLQIFKSHGRVHTCTYYNVKLG